MKLVKAQLAFLALAVIGVFGSAVAAAASDPPPVPASSLEPFHFGGEADPLGRHSVGEANWHYTVGKSCGGNAANSNTTDKLSATDTA
jgi:hypothetical protein